MFNAGDIYDWFCFSPAFVHFLLKFIDLFKILLRLLSYLRKLDKVHKCIKNHRIVVGTMPRNVLNFLNLELIWYWKFLSQPISFQHYLDLWIHSNFIHLYIICFCQSLSFISSCMHTYEKKIGVNICISGVLCLEKY